MVDTLFVDGIWEKEIVLGKEVLEFFAKEKIASVALFASVQFLQLDTVRKQLQEAGIVVKETKAKRTHVQTQVLGCDAYHDSYSDELDADAILYIGDGLFHPKAILLSQARKKSIKDIIIWDPVSVMMKKLGKSDIERQWKRREANIKRFIAAETIGILVTIKPGQQYLHLAEKLRADLVKNGKKGYIFIDNTIDISLFENYPFIDAWVNTACPRIGMDDIVNVRQSLVNIKEAFDPVKALEELA
ncbi:MAG: diphthamide synthesis protein [Nanoarchaeota archaeon]|nr:diphthamide synthesis protein [Nanoarchaeota archaeon]